MNPESQASLLHRMGVAAEEAESEAGCAGPGHMSKAFAKDGKKKGHANKKRRSEEEEHDVSALVSALWAAESFIDAQQEAILNEGIGPNEQAAIRSLMKKLHHLIAPETVHSQAEHLAIKEGPITGANAMLQPNAASVLTCKEIVDVVAGFLLKRKQHGGEAMKRDASAVRLLNRGICLAFSQTITSVTYHIDKDQPGRQLQLLNSFPGIHSITITGRGKGAAKAIDAVLDSLSKGRVMKRVSVVQQTISKTSIKRLVELCHSPSFRSLEALVFQWARIDLVAMKDLVAAWKNSRPGDFLPNLRFLSLYNNDKMGDSAMLALIEAWETGLAPSLEELDLRLCAMGSTSLMRLVNAIRRGTFPSLRTLALGTEAEDFWRPNQGGLAFVEKLAEAIEEGALTCIEELHLKRMFVTENAARLLVQCHAQGLLANLKVLSLSATFVLGGEETMQLLQSTFGDVTKPRPGYGTYFGHRAEQ